MLLPVGMKLFSKEQRREECGDPRPRFLKNKIPPFGMKTFEIVVVAAAAVLGRAGAQLVTCPGVAGKFVMICDNDFEHD